MATLIVVLDIVYDGRVARGGHTMYVLQWLWGLQDLGHEVLLLDLIDRELVSSGWLDREAYGRVIGEWWQPEQTALLLEDSGESLYGLSTEAVRRAADRSAALFHIGIPGQRQPHPLISRIRPRILIEQDPGYTHVWASTGDPAEIFGEQDLYYTVGGNVGTSRCAVPTAGIQWRAIWNPVVLDWWPAQASIERDRFTTVASWWGGHHFEFEGELLGPKAYEFRKFLDLPHRLGEELEIALEIEPGEPDYNLLRSNGWRIEDPGVAGTPSLYRDYITGSRGEFACAKGGYVGTRCGWFSDRSSCYLAAGRPVVLQATGFADLLPTGKGLFSVSSPEEAADAIRSIRTDYQTHSAQARAIASAYFDSRVVLPPLLREAGIKTAATGY